MLVLNADVITTVDFSALADFHGRHGHDGTVAVAQHELKIPFGVVRYDSSGLFSSIEEKPSVLQFVAAGVYLLGPEFIPLVPREGACDMPDLLNAGKRLGLRIGLFPIHEPWADLGRPEDLNSADSALRRPDRRGSSS
jgi:NDP-sugar pyrophosphorylase family protein